MTAIETNSTAWLAIAKHIEKRIEELHSELEAQGLDPRKTDFIRGQISALRDIKSLPRAGDQPDIETPAQYT